LKHHFKLLFPKAIYTLDVHHVVERLWALGRHYHKEGTEALENWVTELKRLVYGGKVRTLLKRLKELLHDESKHGPGTKGRRNALRSLLGYVEPRQKMMR